VGVGLELACLELAVELVDVGHQLVVGHDAGEISSNGSGQRRSCGQLPRPPGQPEPDRNSEKPWAGWIRTTDHRVMSRPRGVQERPGEAL
jgi:hypothetical protein